MLAFCCFDSFDGFLDGLALEGFVGLGLPPFPLHFDGFPLQGFLEGFFLP